MYLLNLSFFLVVILWAGPSLSAQSSDKAIMVVRYESTPITQYNTKPTADGSLSPVDQTMSTVREHFSLYVNLQDRSSIYLLDSLTHDLPAGQLPSTGANVYWAITNTDKNTFKSEGLFDQTMFTDGKVGEINWTITDESKVIKGLKCYKATVADKTWMLTAWYTKDVPVATGPSVFQGLPGLVVSVEDFFWTTELAGISYLGEDSITFYQSKYDSHLESFMDKKNKKFRNNEAMMFLKKAEVALEYYKYIHGAPFAY